MNDGGGRGGRGGRGGCCGSFLRCCFPVDHEADVPTMIDHFVVYRL